MIRCKVFNRFPKPQMLYYPKLNPILPHLSLRQRKLFKLGVAHVLEIGVDDFGGFLVHGQQQRGAGVGGFPVIQKVIDPPHGAKEGIAHGAGEENPGGSIFGAGHAGAGNAAVFSFAHILADDVNWLHVQRLPVFLVFSLSF